VFAGIDLTEMGRAAHQGLLDIKAGRPARESPTVDEINKGLKRRP